MKAAVATNIGKINVYNCQPPYVFFIKERIIGVFNGHGRHGHTAATTAADVFASATEVDPDTFAVADAAVCADLPPLTSNIMGGTSATVVQINEEGTLIVAHLGEGSVVWIFDAEDAEGRKITKDHTLRNRRERERIYTNPNSLLEEPLPAPAAPESSSIVLKPCCDRSNHEVRWDGYNFHTGIGGVHLRLTRALGNPHLKPYGFSADPTITVTPPPAKTRVVVVASSNFFYRLTPEQVRAVVFSDHLLGDAPAAADALLKAAEEAQKRVYNRNVVTDVRLGIKQYADVEDWRDLERDLHFTVVVAYT